MEINLNGEQKELIEDDRTVPTVKAMDVRGEDICNNRLKINVHDEGRSDKSYPFYLEVASGFVKNADDRIQIKTAIDAKGKMSITLFNFDTKQECSFFETDLIDVPKERTQNVSNFAEFGRKLRKYR